ncbi:MAG TPA: arginase [Candidatus Aphodousia gallistercoris]|nr:arginase [Candidatus Aphodousia gallistercoris]
MLGLTMTKAEEGEALQALKTLARHDTAYWLFRINEASVVGNVRRGLLPVDIAKNIREALASMERDADEGRWMRPQLYITFEPEMLKRCGMQASILHVGRSSQDILATTNGAQVREALLMLSRGVQSLIQVFLDKADQFWDTVVPFYTNGVQAQPGRYSHYLYAQAQSWGRDLDRLFECLSRYDFCAMGSAVLNGSVWPLDQEYTAKALGYAKTGDNAFDSVHMAGNDFPYEASQIVQSLMMHITNFIQDFMVQYAQTRPWIILQKAGSTYISSAMPQKRNPGLINDCRRDAAVVTCASQNVMLRIHNLNEGMADPRDILLNLEWLTDAYRVIHTFEGIVEGLQVNKERALEELNSDWTCTQNIADVLVKVAGVPFRQGHHFASVMVTWARANTKMPSNVTYAEVCEQWKQFAAKEDGLPAELPLDEKTLFAAMDPTAIVEARETIGGPQEADMQRQKALWAGRMQKWQALREDRMQHIAQSLKALHDDLAAL